MIHWALDGPLNLIKDNIKLLVLEKGTCVPLFRSIMSRDMLKPAFCENKVAESASAVSNREADQRLWFRYIDSTTPLLP